MGYEPCCPFSSGQGHHPRAATGPERQPAPAMPTRLHPAGRHRDVSRRAGNCQRISAYLREGQHVATVEIPRAACGPGPAVKPRQMYRIRQAGAGLRRPAARLRLYLPDSRRLLETYRLEQLLSFTHSTR